MLNIAFGQSFPLAVALSCFKGIISIIERNHFGDSRLIIHIKDIVILSCREEVISGIVFWLSLHSLRTALGYHISDLDPGPILPDISFRVHAISEDTNLTLLLALYSL